ncbi:GTP-binding protein [Roseibium sp. MMSF_3544]|uniref:CobW family GTP-binding protein n=1 Tax=unclassified Roseibium TaxID=2629323 RepID=UPI00273E9A80|nr:GTP-binding protein [Roseibium sp. MMSF_3544]
MNTPGRIPVILLSGFLGSGKSTLLNTFLNDPSVQDTAVIINEFGEVPVDHLLVRRGETTISQVSTGCLCCSDTTDIHQTLQDLSSAALEGVTGKFSRVIVEMSGLGDPAPLVNALSGEKNGTEQPQGDAKSIEFYLAGVVTLFDAVAGASSVENHFEALKQIAFADRIVLTKTDLASNLETPADFAALSNELRELNASAEILDRQSADVSALFSPRPYAVLDRGEDVAGWLALEAALALEAGHATRTDQKNGQLRHGAGIRTFSIVSDTPLPEQKFRRFLSLLQDSAGQRLLRVKGIVSTEATPEEPLIVHAVQHVVSRPVRLPAWPDEDRRTRLVFITDGVDPEPVRALFTAVIDAVPFSFSGSFKKAGNAFWASFTRAFSTLTSISRRSQ